MFRESHLLRITEVLAGNVDHRHPLKRRSPLDGLIGWSLGGIFARDLAVKMPEAVRQVITLGSPFTGDIHASNARRIYEMTSGEAIEMARPEDLKSIGGDMPVPTTSIYTRTDGIVNWKTCLVKDGDTAENIEVLGASHKRPRRQRCRAVGGR
jgi:hypothetical protein